MEGRLKANHALKGGMRMVELRSKKSNSCGRVEHWIPLLAMTVAKHFDTQYFYQKRSSLQVVFYGIKQNADCAGYAFAATFNRVTKLSSEFVPSKDGKVKAGKVQSTYSRISRMSYRNGLVEGLFETVKSSKQSHPKPNFANGTDKTHASSGIDVKSDPFDSDTESGPPQWESEFCSSEDDNGKENCRWERPQQGEQRRSAALSAIILHSQKVGEDFLKEKKIKVKTRKMDGPVIWDGDAFLKGKKDSKAINIGQRGITAKARKA